MTSNFICHRGRLPVCGIAVEEVWLPLGHRWIRDEGAYNPPTKEAPWAGDATLCTNGCWPPEVYEEWNKPSPGYDGKTAAEVQKE